QCFHAIHPGHLQVQRDHVRSKLLDLLQSECAIHRCSDHVNRRVALDDLRNQLPHQRRIVNHEDSDHFLAHAEAPAARRPAAARPMRSTTADKLRISTTVPSPRMDAPLTISVVTRSSSKALMTNSSSPTKWSTISPNLRSPRVTTTMNDLLFFPGASPWPIPLRRTSVKTSS